jgi:hypothetical protein
MATLRYRVIDTAGSELGFVTTDEGPVGEGDMVEVEVVGEVLVVEVYDDEVVEVLRRARRADGPAR